MSPNSSWNSQGSLYRRSDLWLPYYTMAAMVVAGKVRSLKSLGTEIKIAR